MFDFDKTIFIDEENNRVIKKYSCREDFERFKFYYSTNNAFADLFPRVYDIGEDHIVMDLIRTKAYYPTPTEQIEIMVDLVVRLKMKAPTSDRWLYRDRFENVYIGLQKDVKTPLKLKSFFVSEFEKCVKFYREYYGESFLLHGDLHNGNILYDDTEKRLRVIDPIVTVAPIEFEFTRGLQNLTFGTSYDESELIDEVCAKAKGLLELDSTGLWNALYIDSVLRCMETVRDFPADSEEVRGSFDFVQRLKNRYGGLKL